MQRYNILQAIFMSFYSKDLYRDVAFNWGGKTFLYLLMVVAISWIPFVIALQLGINFAYHKLSREMVNQIPVLTIRDGKISTPENRPYLIKDPETNETVAIIDTTGQYQTIQQAQTNLLVTQTAIITQPRPNETKINQVPSNMNMTINPVVVHEYVQKYLGFAWIILYVLFVLGAYIYRIVQALIYAIIGKIMAAMGSVALGYDRILQIAIVALTPAILLSMIFDIFSISFPGMLFFYFILSMIYLYFGIQASKTTKVSDSLT